MKMQTKDVNKLKLFYQSRIKFTLDDGTEILLEVDEIKNIVISNIC